MESAPRPASASSGLPRPPASRRLELRALAEWTMLQGPPVVGKRRRTPIVETVPPGSVAGAAAVTVVAADDDVAAFADDCSSDTSSAAGEADVSYDDDLRPCEPVPPLPPAALRVMFDFPASSTHRYDAGRIPLELIASTVDVEVVEGGPFGRQAVARRPIRAGTVLGWFDGLHLHGDPLLHLHPYSYARTGTSCVIGSPLAWTSYVDDPHGTPASHNVETKLDLRCVSSAEELRGGPGGSPPPKPRRNLYWPYMRAVADIPAGAPLLVSYGEGYWGDLASRNEVFGRLAALARSLPDGHSTSRNSLRELATQLQSDCDLAPVMMTHWRPLFERIAEQKAVAAAAAAAAAASERRRRPAAPRAQPALSLSGWSVPAPEPRGRFGALPPGPPPAAPPPAVRAAMFAFPLAPLGSAPSASAPDVESAACSSDLPQVRLTYQPADFRIADVAAPPSVGLWREHASGAVVVFARVPFAAGTRLGWFDGLVLPGSADPLINLHPYCVTRIEQSARISGDSIIGSPTHWVTHVGYEGPQRSANVAYDGERRLLPPSAALAPLVGQPGARSRRGSGLRYVRWPYVYATRDIAAREILSLPSDPGYAAATQERREVFGALCQLAALGAVPALGGRELTPLEIDARLCLRFKQAPSDVSLWTPLLARARGNARQAVALADAAPDAAGDSSAAAAVAPLPVAEPSAVVSAEEAPRPAAGRVKKARGELPPLTPAPADAKPRATGSSRSGFGGGSAVFEEAAPASPASTVLLTDAAQEA